MQVILISWMISKKKKKETLRKHVFFLRCLGPLSELNHWDNIFIELKHMQNFYAWKEIPIFAELTLELEGYKWSLCLCLPHRTNGPKHLLFIFLVGQVLLSQVNCIDLRLSYIYTMFFKDVLQWVLKFNCHLESRQGDMIFDTKTRSLPSTRSLLMLEHQKLI